MRPFPRRVRARSWFGAVALCVVTAGWAAAPSTARAAGPGQIDWPEHDQTVTSTSPSTTAITVAGAVGGWALVLERRADSPGVFCCTWGSWIRRSWDPQNLYTGANLAGNGSGAKIAALDGYQGNNGCLVVYPTGPTVVTNPGWTDQQWRYCEDTAQDDPNHHRRRALWYGTWIINEADFAGHRSPEFSILWAQPTHNTHVDCKWLADSGHTAGYNACRTHGKPGWMILYESFGGSWTGYMNTRYDDTQIHWRANWWDTYGGYANGWGWQHDGVSYDTQYRLRNASYERADGTKHFALQCQRPDGTRTDIVTTRIATEAGSVSVRLRIDQAAQHADIWLNGTRTVTAAALTACAQHAVRPS